ncbi:MAG: 3-carboxy-cis,cis-muconate cycloisomerase [Phenylobacterium sp.]|uniref:3-carboxy-cis,cis-muconate cycloisomerase n=1 Tax=Phenylobacterium sp. TaxID=1871053 RepID=UPI0025E3FCED|nr:3-carboxy-cis,cis-muconate cycloisomerase [Phenylobacterium sp.]MBI1198639.1 3-carboxy-cis,cis-muconate cycloisomerase [Phenylobacterium sp.]
MGARIRDRAGSTAEMLEAFGDESLVAAALSFEAALARAQAAEGVIPAAHAALVAEVCEARFDIDDLAERAAHAGTLAIPLVALLRERIVQRAPDAAGAVHRGATSQDVADTALMLQAKAGMGLLMRDAKRLEVALAALARTHAATPMLARTLLQPAAPITFGLKAAQWRAGIMGAVARLNREAGLALVLQLGGPVGALGDMDGRGVAVAERVAETLGLAGSAAPWHARREAVAGLGAALAILTGAVAKVARDVALMAQGEVAEAFEPRVQGRGGSSAMAHKRNPAGCQIALSAAVRTPHLAATLMSAAPGAHERDLGGWQAEAPVLAELFQLAHGAVVAMADVAAGLQVDTVAMARNLAAADVGDDVGEAEALTRRLLEMDGA